MMQSFTYDHPKYNQPLQHDIVEILEPLRIDHNHVSIKFKDNKGRVVTIATNAHYVLRSEAAADELPEVEA